MNEQKEISILGNAEKKICEQVEKEYRYCEKELKPKLDEWNNRLKLYSNQRKLKTSVGDPLLFTVFQTIFASLYDDKLSIMFEPREGGDVDVAENLNQLAEYDYEKMEKEVIDYEWIWDTLFFGRGLCFLSEFNRKKMLPIPEIVSPLTVLRDPKAISVNGNVKGYGGVRFLGREMQLTDWQLKSNPDYFNITKLIQKENFDSLIAKAQRARNEAQGREVVNQELTDNGYFDLLEWFTYIDGKKHLVTLGNNRKTIIRFRELKDQEKWPVIDRTIFPTSHDWDGVSVPDLVEDKQRARAKLINAGLDTAYSNAHPMYLFDINKIKRRDYLNFEFNKFIPVDGEASSAISPMKKDRIGQEVNWILDLIDQGTQRAMATPEIQQGQVSGRQRTLGELELVTAKVDTRYSLSAKIFGWSERRFWERWYWLYKNYFKDGIDEKIVRLSGIWGPEFRSLTRDNIITRVDPDIRVESSTVSNSKKITQRELLRGFINMSATLPGFPVRESLKELAKLSNFRTDQVKMLFPPTYEELKAEEENLLMEKGTQAVVSLTDEHITHMLIHSKLNDSEVRDEHVKFHKQAMKIQKENEMLFQTNPGVPQETGPVMPEAELQETGGRIPEAYKQ